MIYDRSLLSFLHVLGIGTLFALGDFECDAVADIQFVKSGTYDVIGVEEQVFLLTFDGNESKSFFCLGFDCSSHLLCDMIDTYDASKVKRDRVS